MKMSVLTIRGLLLAPVIALAGCANQTKEPKTIVSGDDYEYVTPLGSNIPVRVKKGEKASSTSPTASISGEEATNALHGGGSQVGAMPGQKP